MPVILIVTIQEMFVNTCTLFKIEHAFSIKYIFYKDLSYYSRKTYL